MFKNAKKSMSTLAYTLGILTVTGWIVKLFKAKLRPTS